MTRSKDEIINNHCYTELVYQRINKKLDKNFSNAESKGLIQKVLEATDVKNFEKIGKNYYISNLEFNIKITINSNTFRVITVDKLVK
jgi:hypothetical protein